MAARNPRNEGGTPHRRAEPLTSFQRAARDGLIAQREAQGWAWKAIGEEAGLSARRCQEIAKRERGTVSLLRRDPAKTIERLLTELERVYSLYLLVAREADSSSAAVGALAGATRILDRLVALLAELRGSRGLRSFADALDLQQVARDTLVLAVAIRQGEIEPAGVESYWRGLIGGELPPVDDEAVRAFVKGLGTPNGNGASRSAAS